MGFPDPVEDARRDLLRMRKCIADTRAQLRESGVYLAVAPLADLDRLVDKWVDALDDGRPVALPGGS